MDDLKYSLEEDYEDIQCMKFGEFKSKIDKDKIAEKEKVDKTFELIKMLSI